MALSHIKLGMEMAAGAFGPFSGIHATAHKMNQRLANLFLKRMALPSAGFF
jgi:hypothetical protein